ncbi:cyclophilin-like fold protein [candidate division KSB1 bacterium]
MSGIKITAENITVNAELNNSPTAKAIVNALPIEGYVNTWGDEIYFEIPVDAGQESDARADVEVGELGFWPVGNAFCIFFGRTPASTDDKPRAASPVNIIGKVLDDVSVLKSVPDGAKILIERS